MKVLLLVIFSETDVYNDMLELQKSYIHEHKNIDTFFVTFNETQSENIIVVENIIYVKGKESYTNILYKTIEALDFLIHNSSTKYDFVVRSNISTIILLENLYNYLLNSEKTNIYTGGVIETLRWKLQPYEISEEKQECVNDYYGLKYIQGIGIIMSYDVVETIIKMKQFIQFDTVDDVKLGIIIREHFPNIYNKISSGPIAKVTYNHFENDAIFIRNRTQERKLDVHTMRHIVLNIKPISYPLFEKIIYLTHKTMDEKLKNIQSQWNYLNPEYAVELYDDDRCVEFLYKYYGKKYCDIFQFIKDGPIKSDFFRACLIYLKGGIYVDADIKPMKPLKEYVDDDVDLMTCISYNYMKTEQVFCYNPQLIIAKKFSSELFQIIKHYENLYDNERDNYNYWKWSICSLFNKIHEFDIEPTINY